MMKEETIRLITSQRDNDGTICIEIIEFVWRITESRLVLREHFNWSNSKFKCTRT